MKKVVLFLVFLFFAPMAIASEEVIMLDTTEIKRLTVPISPVLDYVNENQDYKYHSLEDETDISFSEEDMPENKVLRSFYKYVDDKAVNNKLNKFTSSMLDEAESSY